MKRDHYRNKSLENIVEELDGILYTEEWRQIDGVDWPHEISSFGRVKKKGKISSSGRSKTFDKIVLPRVDQKGYLRKTFRINGVKKGKYVHRLVGFAFIPLVPGKNDINHKTSIKTCNHFSQLEWCTQLENIAHGILAGTQKRGRNPKPYIRKGYAIGKKLIIDILTNEKYPHVKALSEATGKSIKTLRRMLAGERYNTTSFRYEGQEGQYKPKPVRLPKIRLMPVAKFDKDGNLIEKFNDIRDVGDRYTTQQIAAFLNGKIGNVDGFFYKRIAFTGEYVEPVQFISTKKQYIKSETPPTPGKPMVKIDIDGNEVERFPSIGAAAKSANADVKNFKKLLKKGRPGYYKGFFWKFAD